MKKTKLRLSAEKIRVLTDAHLSSAAGGGWSGQLCYTMPPCDSYYCPPPPPDMPPIPPPPPSFGPPAQCWP